MAAVGGVVVGGWPDGKMLLRRSGPDWPAGSERRVAHQWRGKADRRMLRESLWG